MASLIDINGAARKAALQKAILLLIAVALNAVEIAIPRLPFLPWLKPGFANIITIIWIIRFGFKDALLYTALRIWVSGFYFGFSLFTLSLSLTGGLLSVAAMSLLWIALGKRNLVGTIGLGVTGALFHNAGQLAVVYFIMSQNMSLFVQIPFMLGAAVIFGSIVGGLAPVIHKIVGVDWGDDADLNTVNTSVTPPVKLLNKFIVVLTFAVSITLMFINNMTVLASAAVLFSLTALSLNPKKPLTIFYPVKFYTLFLFIAATHLFFTYGMRSDILPFTTNEGLAAFAKQSLRLWCWLQTVHIFKRFGFHEMFINMLYRFFPQKKDTLEAGMIALEHFPEIIRLSKSEKKIPVSTLLFRPKAALTEYVRAMAGRIAGKVNASCPAANGKKNRPLPPNIP
ncbi:MAG: Gx transporter family protein [Chitinispirillia bacterium]|nr:Gx transporter family protein [Chitinispirillia bacterium]MCL2242518.1 Gx transporter family protein [Chitinispirillia bacterium]